MKVMFDSSVLFHDNRGGGVYNYLIKLLPILNKRFKEENDSLCFLRLYFREKSGQPDFINDKNLKSFHFPVKLLNSLWANVGIPDLSWFYKDIDVFHSPHFSLPVMSGTKKILTVNDITYLRHPEYFSEFGQKLNEYGYKKLLPVNIKMADRIIAISQYTKNDLVDYFKIPDEKVSVVHIGCYVPDILEHEKLDALLKKFSLSADEYIYFPAGTFEPRKNISKTISAFNKINTRFPKLKIVISGVGDRSWVKNEVSMEKTIFVRWNTEEEKNALYQGALFVVYPSLYEGFGMPVVEAMGNGKAVLTSNTTSLKEIAEGYAHMVNPEEIESIAEGIENLLVDRDYRKTLENKSKVRAVDFTWEKMAEQTYKIYKGL